MAHYISTAWETVYVHTMYQIDVLHKAGPADEQYICDCPVL